MAEAVARKDWTKDPRYGNGRAPHWGMIGIWERPAYRQGYLNKSITAVVRKGDRNHETDVTYNPPGIPMAVRFIKVPGFQPHNIPPVLMDDEGLTVEGIGAIVKRICDFTTEDMQGLSPDLRTPEDVRYYIALLGNTELPPWEKLVTVWRFKHLPNIMV